MNDYELLYMVCENNEYDFDLLLIKYKPLIYKIVKKYLCTFKRYGYELEDLMQIGYVTLYKSAYLYNSLSHSIFYTYFKNALIKNIANVSKLNSTYKKQVLNNALSYDNEINNSNIRFLDILTDNKNKVDLTKELIIFKNSMPINLAWIFELFYNGYNKKEISILLDEKIDIVRKDFSKIKEHALTYKYLFFA